MIQPERNGLRSSFAAIALLVAGGCTATPPPAAGPTIPPPPTAKIRPQASIGPGEGQLAPISGEGYLDDSWGGPVVYPGGCKVTEKDVASAAAVVDCMK